MMELAHLVSSLRHTDEELHEMQRRVEKAEQGAIDAHAALKQASETMVKWKVHGPPLACYVISFAFGHSWNFHLELAFALWHAHPLLSKVHY
jgi:hypothetical protein